MILLRFAIFSLFLLRADLCHSQSKFDSILGKLDPQKFADAISKKADKITDKLIEKSTKVLDKIQNQEQKLYHKMLRGKDSVFAKERLSELSEKYASLKIKLKIPRAISGPGQYIPKLDSLGTTLKFLDANGVSGKLTDALAKTDLLKNKFQQAEQIKTFIKERRQQLKQQLEKLGMVKELKQINKQVYYYSAQLKEYKAILSDPKKIEKKALELLSKTNIWKDFFRKNSMLASFFPMPRTTSGGQGQTGLAGLQTRAQLTSFIQSQAGMNTIDFASSFHKNIQSALGIVDQLRNKVNSLSSGDLEMPDFKPNNQKTKSFKKRLEIGTNFQSQRSNAYFPTTTDIGFSIGYKLNDKSIVGVGSSAKIGWGRDIRSIRVSGEGISFRSFLDMNLKKGFYITGGFEFNYQQSFPDIRILYEVPAWKKSALLGMTKTVSLKGKFFKKTKVQLLYDFMYRDQMPLSSPLKFRIGYVF